MREINVLTLMRVVWRYRYAVALVSIVSGLIAIAWALTATPIFRAEVVVTPVRDRNGFGSNSLSSQLGGLTSLAGINLPVGGPGEEGLLVLTSRRLVEEFIKRNDVPPLLAHGSQHPPTLWFAVRQFRASVIKIDEDKAKGITTVTVDWTDPIVAAKWANQFVDLANELMRTQAVDDATRNVAYLNSQIARTSVVELQRVMYNLVESETKTLMLASGRKEYALTVVDPAVPPEKRISPQRTLMVLTGLVLGAVLGSLLVLAYDKVVAASRG
jgi:uncharacterized protein involved in exopolysaccharide biosynthesis